MLSSMFGLGGLLKAGTAGAGAAAAVTAIISLVVVVVVVVVVGKKRRPWRRCHSWDKVVDHDSIDS